MFLVSDDFTARTASTGSPQYLVMVRTADGELVALKDKRTGDPYWTPDRQTQIAKTVAENKAAFDEIRAASGRLSPKERALMSTLNIGPMSGLSTSNADGK
jgi:hypothetical protein